MGAAGKTAAGGAGETADGSAAFSGPRGYGDRNAEGLYRWYEFPPESRQEGVTWITIFEHWRLIETDMHQVYGIDLGDRGLLRARTWRWLKVRIAGLLDDPGTRLFTTLFPPRSPNIG